MKKGSLKEEEMKKWIAALVVVVGLGVLGALNYHVIRTDNRIVFLRKTDLTFALTYVDARGMNRYKLYTNPALVKAGIKNLLDHNRISIPTKLK
jgi:hypothetical protein